MRIECLLAVLLVMAAPANAAEFVIDGGFDDPLHAAWQFQNYEAPIVSTIEIGAADAADDPGSGSLYVRKMLAASPNTLRASQCIAVVPGTEYALFGRVFVPAASLFADGKPFLDLNWNTSAFCNDTVPDYYQSNLDAVARDAWVPVGPVLLEAPAGAYGAQIYVGVVVYPPSEGSADFYTASWDDVSFVPEPLASASIAAIAVLATLGRRRMRHE